MDSSMGRTTTTRSWIRGGLEFADGRKLVVHDPRRLARFEISPDEEELGPDVLSLTRAQFDRALDVSRGDGPAIKARLLDQHRFAGIGNLLGDEALFRAGLDPRTPTGRLTSDQRAALYKALRATTRSLSKRGGSHMGDHMMARWARRRLPARRGRHDERDHWWAHHVLVHATPEVSPTGLM